jgi:transcriptional regulator with XRE-family HTH domain
MDETTRRIKKVLAENLKKYRARLKLTQEAAAEKSDIAVRYWQRLEMVSQKDLPSLQMLAKIADTLEIPVWKLIQSN